MKVDTSLQALEKIIVGRVLRHSRSGAFPSIVSRRSASSLEKRNRSIAAAWSTRCPQAPTTAAAQAVVASEPHRAVPPVGEYRHARDHFL
jgi:hypothetical protein